MTKRTLFPWLCIALLFLLGLCILAFPGYRFSGWITLGTAALVLCYQILRILGRRFPRFSVIAQRILTFGLCLALIAAVITGVFIVRAGMGSGDISCDYIIVLGAGVNGNVPSLTLRERLEAAREYLDTYPDTICIVSGGQGPGEDITEASCMAGWLESKGISANRIWQEDKSTSTQENLKYALDLIESRTGARPETVGILSSEYHLFRAGLIAQDQGLTPIQIPARTGYFSLRMNYYLREIAGVWYYLIFGG